MVGQPLRLDRNAIWLPAGDQAGSLFSPGASMSWISPVPSAFTTQISKSPAPPGKTRPNVQWKAICWLSGDHVGYSAIPGRFVTWRTSAPFGRITHTFAFPPRSDMKAIHCPSGDHAGE